MKIKRNKKTLFFALSAALFLFSCGDFSEDFEEDLSSVYTFKYSDSEGEVKTISRSYKIGDTLTYPSQRELNAVREQGLAFPSATFPVASDSEFSQLRTGYVIGGWKFVKNPFSHSTQIPETMESEDGMISLVKVTPQPAEFEVSSWLPVTYRLVFESGFTKQTDSEIDEMKAQVLTYDKSEAIKTNTLFRSGYQFAGWQREKRDNVEVNYEDEEIVKNLSSTQGEAVSLYAVWLLQDITVSFDANGGDGEMESQQYSFYDAPIALPKNTFTKEGFDFDGWISTKDVPYKDCEELDRLNWPNGDTTMSAKWSKIEYTVTFDANGGSGVMSDQTFLYKEGQALSFNSFKRTGYDFKGWLSSDGTTTFSDGQTITLPADSNNVLSATANDFSARTLALSSQWTAQTLKIQFDGNGGTGSMGEETIAFKDGLSDTLSKNDFERIGYDFIGWSTSPSGSVDFSDKNVVDSSTWDSLYYAASATQSGNTATTTLYAVWKKIEYTVEFDANGGSGVMKKQTFLHGESKMLSANSFTKTGYDFKGWSTVSGGTTATITDKESISLPSAISSLSKTNRNATLYAVWTAQTLDIEFNIDGVISPTIIQATYSKTWSVPSSLLPPTSKVGFNFQGWAFDSNETDETKIYTSFSASDWEQLSAHAVSGKTTLYAVFKPRVSLVTIKKGSGKFDTTNSSFLLTVNDSADRYDWSCDNKTISYTSSSTNTLEISYSDLPTSDGDYTFVCILYSGTGAEIEISTVIFVINIS